MNLNRRTLTPEQVDAVRRLALKGAAATAGIAYARWVQRSNAQFKAHQADTATTQPTPPWWEQAAEILNTSMRAVDPEESRRNFDVLSRASADASAARLRRYTAPPPPPPAIGGPGAMTGPPRVDRQRSDRRLSTHRTD